MSKAPNQEATAFDLPSKTPFAAVCDEFEAAWQHALQGGLIPDAGSFLAAVPASERNALNANLEQITRVYKERMIAAGGATVEVAPASRKTEAIHGPMEATVDFPPERKFDPDATVDPEHAGLGSDTSHFQQPIADTEATIFPTSQDTHKQPPSDATMDVAAVSSVKSGELDFSVPVRSDPKTGAPIPMVAGYEILSELGRGGMGVVYKARQLGLNRLVALKMVLAGAHAGEAQLMRFHTEAEAVAHLLHPNIVQIYEVGNHEGLPYFSLEYVDGGCLADKIAGKPFADKEAAQMMEILALAMSFAHQHGIIHRDLKPANVLMTRDGLPKITDFGLAKRLEGDSSQTKSGTLMGTPSYMAPEQARGEVSEMGPLTDVYALGVILYEMLTGRTPFMGASVLETLEQVRTQEPVPPSRLQPRLPADIETICLKCLQKESHKRYDSADALARDLHHFLNGEPIEARPIGNAERLWRWCKRNPRVAALSATVAVLLVSAAVGGTGAAVIIAREKKITDENRILADQRAEAEKAARTLADEKTEEARKAQKLATENAKVAGEQRKLALDTIYNVVSKMEEKLRDKSDMLPLRQDLVDTALEGLTKVSRSAETAAFADRSMGIALTRMGDIFERLSRTEDAIGQYRRSLEIFTKGALQEPENDWHNWNAAVSCDKLGEMCRELQGDATVALDYYRKSLALREGLAAKVQSADLPPVNRAFALAISYIKLAGLSLYMGDPSRSRDYAEKALDQCQKFLANDPKNPALRQAMGFAYYALGKANCRLGVVREGRKQLELCLSLRQQLAGEQAQNAIARFALGIAYEGLGDLELEQRDAKAALDHFQKGHEIHLALYQKDKTDAMFQLNLGNSFYRLGVARFMLGEAAESDKAFRESLKLREGLQKADPNNLQRKLELMPALARCGKHVEASRMGEEFVRRGLKSPDTAYTVGSTFALCIPAVANGKSDGQLTPPERWLQDRYTTRALEALKQAIANGYADITSLKADPDLQPLQSHAAFKELLKRAEAKGQTAANVRGH